VVDNSICSKIFKRKKRMKAKTIGGMIALSLVLTLLAACNSTGPVTPTTDPKAVYTEVVKSVQAQATNDARLTPRPSNTPLPTQTLAPSVTLAASATKNGTPSSTQVKLTPAAGTAAPTLPGLATATLAGGGVPTVPDKLAWVSQSPADNATFGPGESFTIVWNLKNTGTTTWTTAYWARLYGGDRLGSSDEKLKVTVKPNEILKLSIEMKAPTAHGKYNTWWVLSTPELVNFGSFNFSFEVK
jgi:hypothetical protein